MVNRYKLKKKIATRLTNETTWDIRQLIHIKDEQLTNMLISHKCVLVGKNSSLDSVIFKKCIVYVIDDESIEFNFENCHFEDCKLRKSASTEQQERMIVEYVGEALQ